MSKRILVVEDQEDNRQLLRDLLGNAVVPFATGGLVVRACTRGPGWLLDQRA